MGRQSENLIARLSLLVYPEWRDQLEAICARRGVTLSGLLRQIIGQALSEADASDGRFSERRGHQ